ncbi:MAG TPA: hypothetical protein VFY73_12395 [Ideonella sp.]|uniref:TolB family protein n=1 Tax=Ideonella sp. TaxID=1929293 RepID=UPI002E35C6A6|nr:hypothetical protein [Ideonella sp.]HEX5684817.1 hypothetical protein [Ideonella sp.]
MNTSPHEPQSERHAKLRHLRALAAAVVCAATLVACGGGGGGGGGDGGPTGNTPPPSPSPSPSPPPALSGRLWHDNYALDFRDGTQIAYPGEGLPVQVTADGWAHPWPDGTQYAMTDWDVFEDQSSLKVLDLSGNVLYSATAEGYLRDEIPSPASKSMIAARLGEDSTTPSDWIFVDMNSMSVVRQFTGDDIVTWLPDGRYMRMTAQGAISIGALDGSETPSGQLTLPAHHNLVDAWVNRQGTRLALQIVNDVEPTPDSDIWVSNLDGSQLERVTATKMSHYARWSPNGRYLAFDVDTGHFCNGIGCMGTCELWYVPAEARNVTALPAARDALKFEVSDRDGEKRVLGCELMAWTN